MSAARRVCNHSGFRYTIEKVIGEGAFGTVYLIFSLETGERVALKKYVKILDINRVNLKRFKQFIIRIVLLYFITSLVNHNQQKCFI